ncbi:hypothetical protein [Nitrospira sp. BLG_2]|uniref:hypothetical protein n=1 Tax=Nitrospira sp. BLG_2 TaxID=3397507 RepID=UPI003B990A15
MADIGSLVVRIGADASALHKEFDKLGNSAKDFGASLASIGRKFGPALGTAVTTAIALKDALTVTAEAARYAEELDLISQKTGIAVEELQGMTVVLAQTGLGLDALVVANKKLSQTMIEAQNPHSQAAGMMQELGLTASTTSGMLEQIADLFARMPDGAGKAALAVELLGKSGQDLIPILNKGAAGLRESRDRAIELGTVLSGPALQSLNQADTAFDDLSVATKAAGHQLGAVLAPAVTLAVNAMSTGLGITANFFGTIAGGAQAVENIIPLMKAMEKLGLSMEGFKPAELQKALDEQKKFGDEAKRQHEELVAARIKADERATAASEQAFLADVARSVKLNMAFWRMIEEQERVRLLNLDLRKPPDSGPFVQAIKEREAAIENLIRLMPELDRNEAEQTYLHNLEKGTAAVRENVAAYQHRFDALENSLLVQDAVARQQETLYRSESLFIGAADAARRVAFEQQARRMALETAQLEEAYATRTITAEQYYARQQAMELDAEAERMRIIQRFPTFWEQQLNAVAQSNAFSVGAIVNTWTSGIAQVILKGGSLRQAWEATQQALLQGALNTTVQWVAQVALSNAAVVASNAAAAGAVSTIWASAAAFMTGAFAVVAAGFTALGATLISVVTAVGTWVMGVLTAIGTALGFTGFGAPLAGAILAGVVAIGIAIAASKAIKFAQGGVVTGPTNAMIGEGHSPEAVIPLNQRGADFLRRAFGGGVGETVVNTKLYVDGRQIAMATTRHVPRAMRMMGAPA